MALASAREPRPSWLAEDYDGDVITRLPNGDVEVSVRPPLIYLDHWAVREIGKSPARRDHFLETFRARGTLLFSIFNVAEMGQNTGQSYGQIRELLDGVGQYWILIESDAHTVQERLGRQIPPPAAFLVSLPILARVLGKVPPGTYKLGSALDALQDQEFRDGVPDLLTRPRVVQMLESSRAQHKSGKKMLPNRLPRNSPEWILLELTRHLVKDGKAIVNNDAIDILHAAVPLCFAQVVLLEKAWANFAQKLKLPNTHTFAAPNLDQALELIRTFDVSEYRVYRPDPPLLIKA